jgi:hypothetical protein
MKGMMYLGSQVREDSSTREGLAEQMDLPGRTTGMRTNGAKEASDEGPLLRALHVFRQDETACAGSKRERSAD